MQTPGFINNMDSQEINIKPFILRYFEQHEIRSINISGTFNINNEKEISHIHISFINDHDNPDNDYVVDFKIQDESSEIFQFIKSIRSDPEFNIDYVGKPENSGVNEIIRNFLLSIQPRVKKILKEQSVQNIKYVGNTFLLNNTTRFTVLRDEGEGRLIIQILGDDDNQEAKLSAHSLLDGLYLGTIQPVE